MEEVLCAPMALKSANDRQKHHTQAGLRVCCKRALKSAGEHTGGTGAEAFGKPPARKKWHFGVAWSGTAWYRWWRFGIWLRGFVLCRQVSGRGNIGSLREQQPLKAPRAPWPWLAGSIYLNINTKHHTHCVVFISIFHISLMH
jgi:hypothetical protein